MRKFDYRVPRIAIDLPICLMQGGSTHAGRCREISLDGMKIEFSEPIVPGVHGFVDLSFEGLSLTLPVRVARCEPDFTAVQFVCESKEQNDAVARLIAFLAGPRPSTSPIQRD